MIATGDGRGPWKLVALAVLFLSGSFLICRAHATPIRVTGSDLLGVEFSQVLYDFASRESVELALAFDGSRPAIEQLALGRADIALLVLPAGEERALEGFRHATVGYHRLVALVPANCPLERISVPELAAIFGQGGSPPIARWAALGLAGDWEPAPIVPVAPAVGTGVMLEYFRETALGGRGLKPGVLRFRSPAQLAPHFVDESRVLALADTVPPTPAAKLLAVSAKARGPAYLPTPEHLHRGDYPLRLPLRLAFRPELTAKVRPLFAFLMSDAATPHFDRARVVSAPSAARAEQALALMLQ